jgi:hypothetical protein
VRAAAIRGAQDIGLRGLNATASDLIRISTDVTQQSDLRQLATNALKRREALNSATTPTP